MSDIHRPTTFSLSTLSARWRSENDAPPPRRLIAADRTLPAGRPTALPVRAPRCCGTATTPTRFASYTPCAAAPSGADPDPPPENPVDAFREHRRQRARQARVLGMLLVPLDPGPYIRLHRAPDVRAACLAAYGPLLDNSIVSLRELLGVIGAHQWRIRGVEGPALGARIHPHYGVFSPVRGEYVDLAARAPLPAAALGHSTAFDLGTGTGVLAAVLARRGLRRVLVTDANPRALACLAQRLGQ